MLALWLTGVFAVLSTVVTVLFAAVDESGRESELFPVYLFFAVFAWGMLTGVTILVSFLNQTYDLRKI
jgi:hypothetical protein